MSTTSTPKSTPISRKRRKEEEEISSPESGIFSYVTNFFKRRRTSEEPTHVQEGVLNSEEVEGAARYLPPSSTVSTPSSQPKLSATKSKYKLPTPNKNDIYHQFLNSSKSSSSASPSSAKPFQFAQPVIVHNFETQLNSKAVTSLARREIPQRPGNPNASPILNQFLDKKNSVQPQITAPTTTTTYLTSCKIPLDRPLVRKQQKIPKPGTHLKNFFASIDQHFEAKAKAKSKKFKGIITRPLHRKMNVKVHRDPRWVIPAPTPSSPKREYPMRLPINYVTKDPYTFTAISTVSLGKHYKFIKPKPFIPEKKATALEEVKTANIPVKQPETGWGSHMFVNNKKWQCQACFCFNSNDRTQCEACESPRYLASPDKSSSKKRSIDENKKENTKGTISSSGFTFASSGNSSAAFSFGDSKNESVVTNSNNESGFKFGSDSKPTGFVFNKNEKKTPSTSTGATGFVFSKKDTLPSTSTNVGTGFAFSKDEEKLSVSSASGKRLTFTKEEKKSPSTTVTTPGFIFHSKSSLEKNEIGKNKTATSTSVTKVANAATPFGSSPNSASADLSANKSTEPSKPISSKTTFTFGENNATASPGMTTSQPRNLFGNKSPTTSSSTSMSKLDNTPTTATTLNFKSATKEKAPPVFKFGSKAPSNDSFKLGANADTKATITKAFAKPAFSFPANQATSSNQQQAPSTIPFKFGSTTSKNQKENDATATDTSTDQPLKKKRSATPFNDVSSGTSLIPGNTLFGKKSEAVEATSNSSTGAPDALPKNTATTASVTVFEGTKTAPTLSTAQMEKSQAATFSLNTSNNDKKTSIIPSNSAADPAIKSLGNLPPSTQPPSIFGSKPKPDEAKTSAPAPKFTFGAVKQPSQSVPPTIPPSVASSENITNPTSNPTSTTATFAFGAAASNNTTTTSSSAPAPFAFGSSSSNNTITPQPSFPSAFGNNQNTNQASTFTFGNSNNNTASTPAPFTFGNSSVNNNATSQKFSAPANTFASSNTSLKPFQQAPSFGGFPTQTQQQQQPQQSFGASTNNTSFAATSSFQPSNTFSSSMSTPSFPNPNTTQPNMFQAPQQPQAFRSQQAPQQQFPAFNVGGGGSFSIGQSDKKATSSKRRVIRAKRPPGSSA